MNGMCRVPRDYWTLLLVVVILHPSVCLFHAPPRPAARSPSVPLDWSLLPCHRFSLAWPSPPPPPLPGSRPAPRPYYLFFSASFSFFSLILRGCCCYNTCSNSYSSVVSCSCTIPSSNSRSINRRNNSRSDSKNLHLLPCKYVFHCFFSSGHPIISLACFHSSIPL